ncbi:hypothetical protein BX600DRAFT_414492 [Xylariales sp. PMI_506]|nr:hypothetical protein BX600DRAFT_414492 [Xylariales sp. PMI_506]
MPRRFRRTLLRAATSVLLLLGVSCWFWSQLFPPAADDHLSALRLEHGLKQCAAHSARVWQPKADAAGRRTKNPRWNAVNGQNEMVILRNATLFDGQAFLSHPVDIYFKEGLIIQITPTASISEQSKPNDVSNLEFDLGGQFVTPGLVDMHSHHTVMLLPESSANTDVVEVHPDFGPLTPYIRIVDGMKAYDQSIRHIVSGGITSSLILPGSANVIGGEAVPIKNRVRPGANKELVVEELLLEYGIPVEEHNRYMKLACGENPKYAFGHTRLGNAWLLRKHLTHAQHLMKEQDAWCTASISGLTSSLGKYPEDVELENTVAMLRGDVDTHIHCYEAADIETILRIGHEFGFKVRAFHHALSAWQVPEMIKEQENGSEITVATFAEIGLYKMEANHANLYAGKTLVEHNIPLAYKSDHSTGPLNARYLLHQAAVGHSFHVPADYALRAVTSVPAKAIRLDHRIGYVRPGYDADLVVWDAHPLSIGATPRQVYIDGVALLDPAQVEANMDYHQTTQTISKEGNSSMAISATSSPPKMRPQIADDVKSKLCDVDNIKTKGFIITGIRQSFLGNIHPGGEAGSNLTLVVSSNGQVVCLGTSAHCDSQVLIAHQSGVVNINLSDGYLTPGLTAVTQKLGMVEVDIAAETGDGNVSPFLNPGVKANINHAKYGIVLDGRPFKRARMGGITRAITPPLSSGGLVRGVSTGIFTSGKRRLIDGGIFRDDVALHIDLGANSKVSHGAISMAIQELRRLLTEGLMLVNDFASALRGDLPLVVYAKSVHDIEQLILLKRDFFVTEDAKSLNIVIYGGHGAPHVAKELAEANIPIILTADRGNIAEWDTKDSFPGPPLSRSAASILSEAGVKYAIAIEGNTPEFESRIHDLVLEASWTAKYAGLRDDEAIRLVTSNVEEILGLEASNDIVVWEGNPLQYGSRPSLAFQEVPGETSKIAGAMNRSLELVTCWPDENDE